MAQKSAWAPAFPQDGRWGEKPVQTLLHRVSSGICWVWPCATLYQLQPLMRPTGVRLLVPPACWPRSRACAKPRQHSLGAKLALTLMRYATSGWTWTRPAPEACGRR